MEDSVFDREIVAEREVDLASVLDLRTRYKDRETLGAGAVDIHLSSDGLGFGGSVVTSKLTQDHLWPLYRRYGYVGLSQYRYANDIPEKAFVIDMHTFASLFRNPKEFARRMRESAAELALAWNDKFAGAKNMHHRTALERVFKLGEAVIAGLGGRGGASLQEHRSQLILTLTTYQITKKLMTSSSAKITPEDVKVTLKLRTTAPSAGSAARRGGFRYTAYGIYMNLRAFEKLALSKEIAGLVEEADRYIEDHCCGGDPAAEDPPAPDADEGEDEDDEVDYGRTGKKRKREAPAG
jgi:hypothetical protein